MSEPPGGEAGETTRALAPVRERMDGYFRNGEWVPRDTVPDPRPPGRRARLERWVEDRFGRPWNDPRMLAGAAAVLVLVLVLAAVVVAAVTGSTTRAGRMPTQQRQVLAAITQGQRAVRHGNDLTVVTAARDRSAEICRALGSNGRARDWLGTISDVDTVTGGDQGRLAVSIGRSTHLRTWSRASQDGRDHTLVDSHSDVYRALAGMHEGDRVRFSGDFIPSDGTCLHETSVFDRNGVESPSFVFRFTAVARR